MTTGLWLRTGFEIELLAPKGSSRRALADEIALRRNGIARPVWHHDSEPSLVPGLGRFLNLTQGFEVVDPGGSWVCTLVDDITIVADLDTGARPVPGWHRLLTDDARLLGLLARQANPAVAIAKVLDQVAGLWGVPVQRHGEFFKVDDAAGATVAIAAPQGGERERPCEIVTPPLVTDHRDYLEALLSAARELDFRVPHEAAVHLHYDGALFRSPDVLSNVIRLFGWWREPLRELLHTNPACRRLAPLPAPLVESVERSPTSQQLRDLATASGLTKFFDVNLTQLFAQEPLRDTLEIRILAGSIDADEITQHAALIEGLLARCQDPTPLQRPPAAICEAVAKLRRIAAPARVRVEPLAQARGEAQGSAALEQLT